MTLNGRIRRPDSALPDLVCLSHLRWDWVFQRPQHLMTRAARDRRMFFFEEPILGTGAARLEITSPHPNVWVVVPHIPENIGSQNLHSALRHLLDLLFRQQDIAQYVLWYYTPMALEFTRHLEPASRVYDCMDELSAFAGAPASLKALETELMRTCDVVFTGGYSLYEAKLRRHPNVYPFPSSVDVEHFKKARTWTHDPDDQASIPSPRLGFYGVIDERLDLPLIEGIAAARPAWHLVFVGPITKVDPAMLPRAHNIHYLGKKQYEDLPGYVSGWNVALLPFARNEATRFISPTKTPEYLAAGKPVVSTSIHDVVRTYGQTGLVEIADTVEGFITAVERALQDNRDARLQHIEELLKDQSWDHTWSRMQALVADTMARAVLR